MTASAGPQDILAGTRQVRIVVPGLAGAALAVGRGTDQVRATSEQGVDDRALWVLRPEGDRYRIVLASEAGELCMTVVHDAAPGSVRGRPCDPTASTQLFRIDRVADGSYSLFQGKRYVQVVDGSNALVPDLPEGLTTTYEFEDQGPAPR
ncbi:RICIN domain-containing protein [Micromonospora tarensis]|uniref:RICIN domain-containing protein n=1 Tax=Micromonospora tarensis TaxID=2806100 RepID=A0ABS1YI79_9ACTN|nr:RICIN domain-containing protein [Micromonospora tarensis]MBM0277113.1 RICIN domain-containing protein [Micromonospora tarensis]